MDIKPVKIDATVMWAFLKTKNEISNKYQVDLCNLSDADVKALKDIGIKVKSNENKPEKGRFITCKSVNYEIPAYDTHGVEIDVVVGNGSKARALIGAYEWRFKRKTGVSPSIKKLVITDLVEYTREEEEEEEEAL